GRATARAGDLAARASLPSGASRWALLADTRQRGVPTRGTPMRAKSGSFLDYRLVSENGLTPPDRLVIEFPGRPYPEVNIVHGIAAHGIIADRIVEVLVDEIVAEEQVHPADGGGHPRIHDRIRRKFNTGIVVIELADINSVRRRYERRVEPGIQPDTEVHHFVEFIGIEQAVPSVKLRDGQHVVKVGLLVDGQVVEPEVAQPEVLPHGYFQQVDVGTELRGFDNAE